MGLAAIGTGVFISKVVAECQGWQSILEKRQSKFVAGCLGKIVGKFLGGKNLFVIFCELY